MEISFWFSRPLHLSKRGYEKKSRASWEHAGQFDLPIFRQRELFLAYLERVFHFNWYVAAWVHFGCARVAGKVASNNWYLYRLILDGGHVLQSGSGFFRTARRCALGEARLSDVWRLGRHRWFWNHGLLDASPRTSFRRIVNTDVNKEQNRGRQVETSYRRVKHVTQVFRHLQPGLNNSY